MIGSTMIKNNHQKPPTQQDPAIPPKPPPPLIISNRGMIMNSPGWFRIPTSRNRGEAMPAAGQLFKFKRISRPSIRYLENS